MTAKAGKIAALYAQTTDTATAFTGEAMTDEGSHTRYHITNAAKRYWPLDAPITVYVDGAEGSDYSIEYPGGVVVFDSPLEGTEAVTVDGEYVTLSVVAIAHSWNADDNADLKDVTTFGDSERVFMPLLKDWSASAELFYANDTFSALVGSLMGFALYEDSDNDVRYEGYGYVESSAVSTATDDVIGQTINITGVGRLYAR